MHNFAVTHLFLYTSYMQHLPSEIHSHFGEFIFRYLAFRNYDYWKPLMVLSKTITETEWKTRTFYDKAAAVGISRTSLESMIAGACVSKEPAPFPSHVESEDLTWVYDQGDSAKYTSCMSKTGSFRKRVEFDAEDFKAKILFFWTTGQPQSRGYATGFHARAKLRLLLLNGAVQSRFLFIDKFYGEKFELIEDLPSLAAWWADYAKKNGFVANDILFKGSNIERTFLYPTTTTNGYHDSIKDLNRFVAGPATFLSLTEASSVNITNVAQTIMSEITNKPTITPYSVNDVVIFSFEELLHMAISIANFKMVKRILLAWNPKKGDLSNTFYWTGLTPMKQAHLKNDFEVMDLLHTYSAPASTTELLFIENGRIEREKKEAERRKKEEEKRLAMVLETKRAEVLRKEENQV